MRQHRGDVRERHLLRLCDESLGEAAVLVLTDHTADEHRFAARADEKVAAINAERERQAAGIQVLDFGQAASKPFLDRAYEVSWQFLIRRGPETGPKLRQLV